VSFLIQTTGSKPTDVHTIVPSQNDSVFITGANGRISGEKTLPVPVQKNIEAENLKFKDSTVNDSTTTKHGYLPKLTGDEEDVFTGVGFQKLPRIGSGFGNIYYVPARETVTIGLYYENVVTTMQIYGSLQVYGKLTLL